MIEVSRLSGARAGRATVRDVTFRARAGEVTALLDPIGGVASGVVRLILGRDRLTAGTALIDGRTYESLDHPAAVVGTVRSPFGPRPWLTPREHIRRAATAAGQTRRTADEVLELVGLTSLAGDRLWGAPAAARVRLAVGCAMVAGPTNYILDDPFRELTGEDARWLRQVLRRLVSQGRTVLIAGGSLRQWARVADRVIVLGGEGVTAEVPPGELVPVVARTVTIRVARQRELEDLLVGMGATVARTDVDGAEALAVTGLRPDDVWRASVGFGLVELTEETRQAERTLGELAGLAVPRVGVLAERGIA